jgi:hypothetical protein
MKLTISQPIYNFGKVLISPLKILKFDDGDLMVSFDQVKKTVQPAMGSLRDCMLGRGYLSGTVTAWRRQ